MENNRPKFINDSNEASIEEQKTDYKNGLLSIKESFRIELFLHKTLQFKQNLSFYVDSSKEIHLSIDRDEIENEKMQYISKAREMETRTNDPLLNGVSDNGFSSIDFKTGVKSDSWFVKPYKKMPISKISGDQLEKIKQSFKSSNLLDFKTTNESLKKKRKQTIHRPN